MSQHENKEEISFIRSPAKRGDYYVFTIPNDYFKSGEIDPDTIYKIILKSLKKKDLR